MQRSLIDSGSFVLGLCTGVVIACGGIAVGYMSGSSEATPLAETTTARECAIRAVYHLSTDDDWGQRALIASTVLNRVSSPDAGIPCGLPASPASVGVLPNSYQWQSAVDAVDAVASGSYVVPMACTGAVEVVRASAVPRAQCVVGDLAFVAAL